MAKRAKEPSAPRAFARGSLTLNYSLVEKLADDLDQACKTLADKGGVHPAERKRVHTGTGD